MSARTQSRTSSSQQRENEKLRAQIASIEARGAAHQRLSRARGAAENSFQECVCDAALYPDEPRDFETEWPTKEWITERRLTWAWSRGKRHGFNVAAAEALAEFNMEDPKYQFFDLRFDEKEAIVTYILQHFKYLRKKRQDQLDPSSILDDIHAKRQKASQQRRREDWKSLVSVCARADEEELQVFIDVLQKAGPEILSSDDEDTAPGQPKMYKRNCKPYRSATGHEWIASIRAYERIVNPKSKGQGKRHRVESDRISLEMPRPGTPMCWISENWYQGQPEYIKKTIKPTATDAFWSYQPTCEKR
ncbi:hypothetical protein FRB90_010614 [Tulasnella sp. 427]|nr:hypothetical protein FRB90_010614 [Tulasnella sp. 427]